MLSSCGGNNDIYLYITDTGTNLGLDGDMKSHIGYEPVTRFICNMMPRSAYTMYTGYMLILRSN